ncbi:ZIP family metal transporter [Candidatus Micrarchaeota archaeon]|nr:ZIP family metal transporter [Candidatus Micrarchaeota archaeon]
MDTLLLIIIATVLDGFAALVGAVTLTLNEATLKKAVLLLVAFSAGALIAGAFFHIIPESLSEGVEPMTLFLIVTFGFAAFFLSEKFLFWHHCHKDNCTVHPYTYLILFGDGIHNFIDGLVIAAAFLVDTGFGIATTVMVISHELPQELGDFAVLVHGGLSRQKALLYNFISQLTAVAGGVIGFFLASTLTAFIPFILPFAAGGFLYIGASDLIPQLHEERDTAKSVLAFAMFALGMLLMLGMKMYSGE